LSRLVVEVTIKREHVFDARVAFDVSLVELTHGDVLAFG
jgi:hypothetical protein